MSCFLFLLSLLYASICRAQTSTSSSDLAAPTAGYCYYPGANPASAQNDRPCDPDAETSMCCPTGWTCMSNKICQVTDGRLAQAAVGSIRRATCTDPSWNDEVCGDFCLNLPTFENEGDLTPCGDNVFVCSAHAKDQSANCAAKQKVFTLPVGQAQTIIALPSGTTSTASVQVSSTGASTLVTSARPSTSASSAASNVNDGDDNHDEKKSRAIAIGAGVAGAAALAAALALIWFYCIHNRKEPSSSRASTPEAFEKPVATDHIVYNVPPVPAVLPVVEVPRPSPSQPPAGGAPPVVDDHVRDDRPRSWGDYDDGETEIASGGVSAAVSRDPLRMTTPPPPRVPSRGMVPPGMGGTDYTSTYDGSRSNLPGTERTVTPEGRVSPLNQVRRL